MTLTCPCCGGKFAGEVARDAIDVGGQERATYHVPRYCPKCRAAFEQDLALDREEIERRRAS